LLVIVRIFFFITEGLIHEFNCVTVESFTQVKVYCSYNTRVAVGNKCVTKNNILSKE
jgi:hypothetical protein